MVKLKYGGRKRKSLKNKGTKVRRNKKVRFNTKKIHKRRVKYSRKHQRGGFFVTDIVRGAESSLKNTVNTLKGAPLSPSPFPTQDQPIDKNVEVI